MQVKNSLRVDIFARAGCKPLKYNGITSLPAAASKPGNRSFGGQNRPRDGQICQKKLSDCNTLGPKQAFFGVIQSEQINPTGPGGVIPDGEGTCGATSISERF